MGYIVTAEIGGTRQLLYRLSTEEEAKKVADDASQQFSGRYSNWVVEYEPNTESYRELYNDEEDYTKPLREPN